MEFIYNREKSLKWNKTDVFFGRDDLLPLWVADMDISIPKELKNRFNELTLSGDFGYSYKGNEFYKAIKLWYNKRYNFDIDEKWIIAANGVVHSISLLVELFSLEDDEIIIQTPIYPPFFKKVEGLKRKVIVNPLTKYNDEYQMDFEHLEKIITAKTKLFLLCNPHNPTGRVWSKVELLKLYEIFKKNNVLIISDEIHGDLTYNVPHIPFNLISKDASNNSIILNSPAKTFNCPSLFSSYMIIENLNLRRNIKVFMERRQLQELNRFGVEAIITLYNECDYWLDELLITLESNIDYTINYFITNLPKVKIIKPQGTYLIWLDFNEYNFSQKELENILINECKIALSSGTAFGLEGLGFMRMNIGTNISLIKIALSRIFDVFSNK